ncbi:MAG: hypothetical protein ACXAB7_07305 [Candidatus Kariarchaeaceae archaeon]|jgi:hypothetical protein
MRTILLVTIILVHLIFASTPFIPFSDTSQEGQLLSSSRPYYPHTIAEVSQSSYLGSPTSVNVTYNGVGMQELNLSYPNNYTIPSLSYANNVALQLSQIQKDRLGFPANLVTSMQEDGVGTLIPNQENNSMKLSIMNTSYSNGLAIDINQQLSGDESIILKIEILNWDLLEENYAFASIQFIFDTFSVSYIYASTLSFSQYITNSSGQLMIFNSLSHMLNSSIIDLAEAANVTEPENLVAIEWDVYKSETYDFEVYFSELSIFTEPDQILYYVGNNSLSSNDDSSLQLQPHIPEQIQLEPYTSATFMITRSVLHYRDASGKVTMVDDNLVFLTNISLSEIILDYSYSVMLPLGFQQIQLVTQTPGINSNASCIRFNVTTNFPTSIEIKALFIFSNDIKVTWDNPVQGKMFHFQVTDYYTELYSVIVDQYSFEIISVNMSLLDGRVVIPSQWSQGDIHLLIWSDQGQYSSFFPHLLYSPAALTSNRTVVVHPGIKEFYPIMIRNITSNEIMSATKITTYQEGKLRAIDDSHGILFSPGEFQSGIHTLFVNATRFGFIPIEFNLTVVIESFSPLITLNVSRQSATLAFVEVYIPEFSLWTVPVNYTIQGIGINFTTRVPSDQFSFTLQNDKWNDVVDYPITIIITLGDELAKYETSFGIPDWDKNARGLLGSGGSGSPLEQLSLIISTSLFVTMFALGFKYYKSKYAHESLQF